MIIVVIFSTVDFFYMLTRVVSRFGQLLLFTRSVFDGQVYFSVFNQQ